VGGGLALPLLVLEGGELAVPLMEVEGRKFARLICGSEGRGLALPLLVVEGGELAVPLLEVEGGGLLPRLLTSSLKSDARRKLTFGNTSVTTDSALVLASLRETLRRAILILS
jgi:hypothetical protein